jgi:hypothetical protein
MIANAVCPVAAKVLPLYRLLPFVGGNMNLGAGGLSITVTRLGT